MIHVINQTHILDLPNRILSWRKREVMYMGKQIVVKMGLGKLKVSSFIKLGKVLDSQQKPELN